ncbi:MULTISPECIES: lysophospholipid acyltransferase family protein [Comamonas]|uniref:lysophospholipid acyltransferase family protein n=1 Tax=Comamonas TaxID=283 RepID=UPI0025803D1C|nr:MULTISPECIES: lysophospholipid acyltransferase family protein [Comamonas]
MAGTWRAIGRFAQMLRHALHGVRVARCEFHQLDALAQQRAVERWAHEFLQAAGVALRIEGQPVTQGPVLLVANHQSWLDIPTLHAAQHCRFVSKAEIARWPLVGRLASAAGTLFVRRSSRRDTQRTVQAMVQALEQGDILAVFPEGTVGTGRELLPFHGNMLQAAIDADVPVQPVALTFMDARTGQVSLVPCEAYSDEPMLRSLWRTIGTAHLVAVVRYGTPEKAQGRDRRTWAQDLQARVQALRQVPVQQAAPQPVVPLPLTVAK